MGTATGCQSDVIAHVTVCFGATEWSESLLHNNSPSGMYAIPQLTAFSSRLQDPRLSKNDLWFSWTAFSMDLEETVSVQLFWSEADCDYTVSHYNHT